MNEAMDGQRSDQWGDATTRPGDTAVLTFLLCRRTWTNALGGSSMGVGSVSKYCLSHSPVPVIVVRPERKVSSSTVESSFGCVREGRCSRLRGWSSQLSMIPSN